MNWVTSVVVPLVTTLVAGGGLYGLVFFRQTRRQMEAGSAEKEATATDTLTGAALRMVQVAQGEARQAREEAASARRRAEAAEERAISAERSASACAAEVAVMTGLLRRYRDYVTSQGLAPIE